MHVSNFLTLTHISSQTHISVASSPSPIGRNILMSKHTFHVSPPPAPSPFKVATPFSDLPADWRAPLPPREFKPKKGPTNEDGEGQQGGEGTEGKGKDMSPEQDISAAGSVADGLRTPAEVLQQATRVTPSRTTGANRLERRMAEAPPGVESLQTENQRRRALPLSQLKRAKPRKRCARDLDRFEPCSCGIAYRESTHCDTYAGVACWLKTRNNRSEGRRTIP